MRGFADQQLHFPDKPLDPGNRRVSLVVLNLPAAAAGEKIAKSPAAPEAKVKAAAVEAKAAEPSSAAGQTGSRQPDATAQKVPAGMLAGVKGLFSKKTEAHP